MPFKTTGQAALGANAPKQDPREANCKTRSKHALFETRQGIRELCLDSRGRRLGEFLMPPWHDMFANAMAG
ncbi:hypothetical protein WJX74_010197 [Apatococcus lobatus]|uniref:Uncharacterized protein n=1 Tax=Apatococcus lobatus TaxID=904363 RepID=A0AAW1SGB7_9CHLO